MGYLPYSDSPGPGWYPDKYALNWEEVLFFLKFLFFLGICLVPTLAVIFGLFKLLLRIGYNPVVYGVAGSVIIGLSTAFWIWLTGGYLAFDVYTTIAGELLGIGYGAFLFTFYIKPDDKKLAAD